MLEDQASGYYDELTKNPEYKRAREYLEEKYPQGFNPVSGKTDLNPEGQKIWDQLSETAIREWKEDREDPTKGVPKIWQDLKYAEGKRAEDKAAAAANNPTIKVSIGGKSKPVTVPKDYMDAPAQYAKDLEEGKITGDLADDEVQVFLAKRQLSLEAKAKQEAQKPQAAQNPPAAPAAARPAEKKSSAGPARISLADIPPVKLQEMGLPRLRNSLYPGEAAYFEANPTVAGMAAEDGNVILNPNSSAAAYPVYVNELSRLAIREGAVPAPSFALTPEQVKFLDSNTYAKASEEDRRATIAARILSGDPSAGEPTAEQRAYVDKILAPAIEGMK